jgi:hypothetical protein
MEKSDEELEKWKKVYERRINRLWEVKDPIFVRLEMDNKRHNYKRVFEKLDEYYEWYGCIIVSKWKPEGIEGRENVRWIEKKEFESDWRQNGMEWETILKEKEKMIKKVYE